MKSTPALTFLVLGIVFLTTGANQRSFKGLGIAFLAIGITFLIRQKRGVPK